VIVAFVIKTVNDVGGFTTIVPHGNVGCELIGKDIISGAEDFTIDYETEIIYGCSDRSRKNIILGGGFTAKGIAKAKEQGDCFAYDTKSKTVSLLKLEGLNVKDFHPHGVSIYRDDSQALFYIINHKRDGEAIEVFKIESPTVFRHLYSIEDEKQLFHINDLHVISPKGFYVSTWYIYEEDEYMAIVEKFGGQKWTYVSYCDVSLKSEKPQISCRKVAEKLAMANGVNSDPSQKFIYVATPLERAVKVYKRLEDNSLEFIEEVYAGTHVDNINVTPEGTLVLGCHPKALTFLRYVQNSDTSFAPSQVLSLNYPKQKIYKEEFLSNGEDISASTVAVIHDKTIYIGGLLSEGILACPQNQ
jgi:arylesterase/paraoxonase